MVPGPVDVAALDGVNCFPPSVEDVSVGEVTGSHVTLCGNAVTAMAIDPVGASYFSVLGKVAVTVHVNAA
jgi:hypothetical protein